jgi:hypothetical protein
MFPSPSELSRTGTRYRFTSGKTFLVATTKEVKAALRIIRAELAKVAREVDQLPAAF